MLQADNQTKRPSVVESVTSDRREWSR